MSAASNVPAELFLSHASVDQALADRLVSVLRTHGVPVWYSRTELRGSDQWHEEIGAALDRWLHIVSGVLWIGLLYYFNVVQIPGLAQGLADKGGPGNAGIIKYIAPRALLWFRWAAVVTAVSGIMLMEFAYGGGGLMKGLMFRSGFETIGVGAWLGLIMLFNVWVLIWPNQKKVIGVVPATDEEKAKARATATPLRCSAQSIRSTYIDPLPDAQG